jgi:hypothetical protein
VGRERLSAAQPAKEETVRLLAKVPSQLEHDRARRWEEEEEEGEEEEQDSRTTTFTTPDRTARSRVVVTMTEKEPPSGPIDGETVPASVEEAGSVAAPDGDDPCLRSVPEKIGEGEDNLRDRQAAFERRRGRRRRSP